MFLIKNLYNLSHNSYKFIKNINKINTKLLFNKNIKNNKHLIIKCLSTNEKKSNEKNGQKLRKDLFDLPFLMNLTPKVVPNIFYTINNFFVVNFYLTPFVDKDFNLKTFLKGSKQVLNLNLFNLIINLNYYLYIEGIDCYFIPFGERSNRTIGRFGH
jgi:hypothetical protein